MNNLIKKRYCFLDELRGFAVLCMVFYHAFYTMAFSFGSMWAEELYYFFMPAEPYFASAFILISGICSQFSRSNIKRGLMLAVIAVAISVITIVLLPRYGFYDCEIYFGILHLLSAGLLLSAWLNKFFKKCPPFIFIVMFLLLFFATFKFSMGEVGLFGYNCTVPDVVYKSNALFFLGAYNATFFSADYFPLLPWLFMFLCGECVGVYALRGKFPRFFEKKHIPPLGFLGRHALIVYVLHQPVIYGIEQGVRYIMALF